MAFTANAWAVRAEDMDEVREFTPLLVSVTQQLVDEVHVFVAPKIIGGHKAVAPVSGLGLAEVPELSSLRNMTIQQFGEDILIEGRIHGS